MSLAGMALLFGGSLILQESFALWQRVLPFFGALFCIYFGQRGYRRICKLETNPDRLLIWNGVLSYASYGKWAFSIPTQDIDRLHYFPHQGIGFYLKQPIDAQIQVLDPRFPLASFLIRAKQRGCDLFFAHFHESVKTGLENIMHTQQSHDAPLLQNGQNGDQSARVFFHKAHGLKGQSFR